MPRSLAFCYRNIAEAPALAGEAYGVRHPCHETVDKTIVKLKVGSIKDILDTGLHEFLDGFISDNNRLGDQVA